MPSREWWIWSFLVIGSTSLATHWILPGRRWSPLLLTMLAGFLWGVVGPPQRRGPVR